MTDTLRELDPSDLEFIEGGSQRFERPTFCPRPVPPDGPAWGGSGAAPY